MEMEVATNGIVIGMVTAGMTVTITHHHSIEGVDIIVAEHTEVAVVENVGISFIESTNTIFMITLILIRTLTLIPILILTLRRRRRFEGIRIEAVGTEIEGEGTTGGGIEGMEDPADIAIIDEAVASFMIIIATITSNIRSLAITDTMDPMDRMGHILRIQGIHNILDRMDRMDSMDPTGRDQHQYPMERMLFTLPLYGINHHWAKRAS